VWGSRSSALAQDQPGCCTGTLASTAHRPLPLCYCHSELCSDTTRCSPPTTRLPPTAHCSPTLVSQPRKLMALMASISSGLRMGECSSRRDACLGVTAAAQWGVVGRAGGLRQTTQAVPPGWQD